MSCKLLEEKLPLELKEYILEYVMPSKKDVMKNHKKCMDELLLHFAFRKFDRYILFSFEIQPLIYTIYHSVNVEFI